MTMVGKTGVLWRFIGKMTCRQVLILMFLAIGAISIAIWSLSSKHGIRSSTASKITSFGGGNGVASGAGDAMVGVGDSSNLDMPRKMLGLIDWTHLSGPELTHRIEELLRIKDSVQNELRGLEAQRSEMKRQVCMLLGDQPYKIIFITLHLYHIIKSIDTLCATHDLLLFYSTDYRFFPHY